MRYAAQMPPRLDAVEPVVRALRAAVDPVLDPEKAAGFEVVASEALTNIVVHGHADDSGGRDVTVELTDDGPVLRLTVIDHGAGGPADLYSQGPTLDEIDVMAESGRGLALIRYYADTVAYAPSPDGNRLILTFRIADPVAQ